MATVYRSKTDWWLLAILLLAMGASLSAALTSLSAGTITAWIVAAFVAVIGCGLPLWLLLTTHYTIDAGQLLIQSGPFKWNVPIADIKSITETSNPLSSPALSLDRLRIDYGKYQAIMISPRDKLQFIRDIEATRLDAA